MLRRLRKTSIVAALALAATVRPTATTTYRAVHDDMTSPTALVRLIDSHLGLTDARRGSRDHLTVTVAPAAPGATVVLQLHLQERFGWWPTQQFRLDRRSQAHFALNLDRRVPARVALTLPDGATELAVSRTVSVGNRGK